MKHTTSHSLFSYWNEVRRGRPAPRRFDIEPSRISHILAETLILERIDFETYRFRLAGTKVSQAFGCELRGEDFFALWERDEDRVTLEHHLSSITKRFQVGVFEFQANANGQSADIAPPARFEMILLPLVHTKGQVDRCLGAISRAYSATAPKGGSIDNPELTTAHLLTPDTNPDLIERSTPGGTVVPLQSSIRSARIVRHERRQFRVYDGGLAGKPKRPTFDT